MGASKARNQIAVVLHLMIEMHASNIVVGAQERTKGFRTPTIVVPSCKLQRYG
jgi:hypothetical protein